MRIGWLNNVKKTFTASLNLICCREVFDLYDIYFDEAMRYEKCSKRSGKWGRYFDSLSIRIVGKMSCLVKICWT